MQAVEVLSKNNVQVTDQPPPMGFRHGFGCDQTMWNRLAPGFEEDHQVIRYDFTGRGRPDDRHGRMTFLSDNQEAFLVKVGS